MATYRIVPYYSSTREQKLYKLERQGLACWLVVDVHHSKEWLEDVMNHLEQPTTTYDIGDK